MRILCSDNIKGMHHIRGARSVPSDNLRFRGRVGRLGESTSIAAASARLDAGRLFVAANRRTWGGCR
jgi:hypothetical protein